MKKLFLLLLTTPFLLWGQYSLNTNPNLLVNSSQIGEDLLLFVPDSAVQILRNPARAAEYSNQFIYLTHRGLGYSRISSYPYEENYLLRTKIPTFSGAFLLGDDASKWLLRISSGVDNSSDSRDSYNKENEENDVEHYYRKMVDTNKRYIASHELSLYRIKKQSQVNIAYGVFGGLDIYSGSTIHLNYLDHASLGYMSSRKRIENTNNINDVESSKYFFGLGFSASARSWDFNAEVAYQKTDFLIDKFSKNTREYASIYYTDSTNNTTGTNSISQLEIEQGSKPDVLHLNMYYRKNAGWFSEDDNYFLRVKGFYSTESQNYRLYKKDFEERYKNDSLYNHSDEIINDDGVVTLENYALELAAGYVLPYHFDDFYLTSGIIFSSNFIHCERKNNHRYLRYTIIRQPTYADGNFDDKIFRLKVPIYLNYTPNDWFELYGGLNYSLLYRDYNEEWVYNSPSGDENKGYDRDKSTFNSSRHFYLGVNLKHKSGLRLQLAFNNGITDYKYWDFSLGYIF